MAAPTIDGINLSQTETINVDKAANILPLPIPTGDSDETETFDMLGVLKTIGVSGAFTGETATIQAKIVAIEAIIDGDQDTSVSFNSDQTGSVQVKISDFSYTWEIPGSVCRFNLKMIQGQ